MKVNGVVQRVDGAYAWVDVSVEQGCGRCNEPGGCGGVNIARPFGAPKQVLRVPNESGAVAGEAVNVVIDDGVPLAAALRVYAAPVLGVLAGAALGTGLAPAGAVDLCAGVGALAGGGLAVLLARAGRLPWSDSRDLPVRLERGGPVSRGECGR